MSARNPARHLSRTEAERILDYGRRQRDAAEEVLALNDKLLGLLAEQANTLERVQWSSTNALGEPSCPRCNLSEVQGHDPTCDLFRVSDPEQVDRLLAEAAEAEDEALG